MFAQTITCCIPTGLSYRVLYRGPFKAHDFIEYMSGLGFKKKVVFIFFKKDLHLTA